jgi:acyl carrier protein
MIPSSFVLLDALPLTPSGKLDRRALPPPQLFAAETEHSFVAPRTEVEQLLAGLWQRVLRIEQVGRHDNFFELGGHSLLATQLVSRMREAFQVELPVRSLFEHPTVVALAAAVEQELLGGAAVKVPPIERASRDNPLPLSFAQQRLWFFDQLRPHTSTYNMPAAVRQTGPLDLEALERTLSEIFRRHEVLRTTFAVIDGRAMQLISAPAPVRLPVIDLSELSDTDRETEVGRLVDEEAKRPFDLARGPLLRFTLLRLGTDQHVVLMTMHHIISDGWSTGVLIREIAALYEAYSGGKPSPLPELEIQYADYAVWQREWLQGEVLEKHLAYWKQQLAHAPHVLNLPTDKPRPTVQSYRGAQETIALSAELAERLKTLSRREGVTLFMTLLAAFQTLLHRYAGHDRIVVGSPIAGRNRAETEGLIGFFVNTLVMCTDFSGSPSFLKVLRRVREAALGAYAHQDMPFEKLVEELAPERSLGSTPLVQVMFVLQNIPVAPVKLTGLNLSQVDIQSEAARFDLHLGMSDTPEGLSATLTYSTDLFEAPTVKRMLGNLELLLHHIAEHPDSLVSSLVELLSEADEQRSRAEEREFKESSSRRLRNIKRRATAKPLT